MSTQILDRLEYKTDNQHRVNVNTGIPESKREIIATGLSKLLADSYLLMLKTHFYHWNVKGGLFHTIHQMTEEQYNDLFEAVDDIAERIRALGYDSPGTNEEFSKLSFVKDAKKGASESEIIADLLMSHEGVVRNLRNVISDAAKVNDEVTVDLLTARSHVHEKTAWMWRSFLEK